MFYSVQTRAHHRIKGLLNCVCVLLPGPVFLPHMWWFPWLFLKVQTLTLIIRAASSITRALSMPDSSLHFRYAPRALLTASSTSSEPQGIIWHSTRPAARSAGYKHKYYNNCNNYIYPGYGSKCNVMSNSRWMWNYSFCCQQGAESLCKLTKACSFTQNSSFKWPIFNADFSVFIYIAFIYTRTV